MISLGKMALVASAVVAVAFAIYGSSRWTDYVAYASAKESLGYVYSEKVSWLWAPYRGAGSAGYWIWAATVFAGWYALTRKAFRLIANYPVTACAATALCGICLPSLCGCWNVAGVLALACTTPVGALLAMCIKPYLVVFVVLHASAICNRFFERESHEISEVEIQPASSCGRACGSGKQHKGN